MVSFIWCRTLGHAWDEFHPDMRRPQFGWRLSIRCERCTSERHDLIAHRDGQLLSREYRYIAGYELGYRVPVAELRMMIKRERAKVARMARELEQL